MQKAFLSGLMMEQPLLVSEILSHAQRCHASTEIVSRLWSGEIVRTTWGEMAKRSAQLAEALQAEGVDIGRGQRIATLAWNGARHLELYYAVPSMGAVLHTLNPRLFHAQLIYIIQHAEDEIIFVDPHLLPLASALERALGSVKKWVAMCDADELSGILAQFSTQNKSLGLSCAALKGLQDYESFIAPFSGDTSWPDLPEQMACGLCYTSGTTGDPKGVLYSHRSTVLHALASALPDVKNLSARDAALPVVPMFHVNAWGIPYSAGIVGCKLILPGPRVDGDSLFELLDLEGATVTVGVPTIWMLLLETMRKHGRKPFKLQRISVGGAACPPALSDPFIQEFGIEVNHGWGMTETSPVGSISKPRNTTGTVTASSLHHRHGRPLFGVQMEIVDEQGRALPHDGKATGELLIKGHWVANNYFGAHKENAIPPGEWFHTGDVANIDSEENIQITDRTKDMIKSGGEWISSIALENAALEHPEVQEAAAIGLPHPKWGERPLLLVVRRERGGLVDESVQANDVLTQGILTTMAKNIPRWWLPNAVIFVQSLPRTATGKLYKINLRDQYRDFIFPPEQLP
jgi:3-(methylthio)propionyl---CoA ligase